MPIAFASFPTQRGFLGKPYYMEAEYITGQHWRDDLFRKVNPLTENGDWRKLLSPIRYCTHSLGPLLAIMEEDLTRVSCFGTGQQADPSEYKGDIKDDAQSAQFQTDSGVVVRVLRTGRCRAKIGSHTYRVFGTEGYKMRLIAKAFSLTHELPPFPLKRLGSVIMGSPINVSAFDITIPFPVEDCPPLKLAQPGVQKSDRALSLRSKIQKEDSENATTSEFSRGHPFQ